MANVVGYSKLMGSGETATLAKLSLLKDQVLRRIITKRCWVAVQVRRLFQKDFFVERHRAAVNSLISLTFICTIGMSILEQCVEPVRSHKT